MRSSYKLWLKKPSFARMEGYRAGGELGGVLVGDGEAFWIYWPNGRPNWGEDSLAYASSRMKKYVRFPIPAKSFSIAHHAPELGTGMLMTIFQPSVFHGMHDLLLDNMDGVKAKGTESIGNEMCNVIEVSYMSGQRTNIIWLSQGDNLPRKLKQTINVKFVLTIYEEWSHVEIGSDLFDSLFSWKPPEDSKEIFEPNLEEGLLRPGTPAPDFQLPLVSGDTFKLSAHRGKPVVLNFWRVGCPPCRVEVPYLETLHKKYESKGLIILGFNCSDAKAVALEFLKKYGVTYRNVVDSSAAANKVAFKDYQTLSCCSAVPLNYLIDAAGKVVEAWYGYNGKDDMEFENALRKMGW
jgi:peroxiredoxin/outer membrane lipoprotein-sorting protein